ncbi:MAG: short-chain dehydrogenase [Candidatus Omnitrophica bacterium CG11_big_fil_rev_8_21_14_0_20_45_26]|uniref:Short-chain dehydrogenase n=1 Tax=Candidatus Abzuiibacterium crystallinum TaxID=1974748 RepID=A0A2H0LLF5_9BACT|nr:MAG: short-chain dehydrogenase [Candidatus Omnitrophica bacterium CG11_big_fil_rev_8_21_14_0_20_45_26]PIW64501.1 MAG: short-chain dehydrogenase [Candidatus Omnitrophica bacterium CG12_big_fil_rev_8_21_14_0_65_45_16]
MKKKTVIITGGNQGIGLFITRAFQAAHYHVLVGARSEGRLQKDLSETIRYCQADVRDRLAHQKLVETAIAWTGQLNVYVNCAGFSGWKDAAKVDESFWDDMIDTNLAGTFWGCQAAAHGMKKGGAIINISSLAGRRGSAFNAVYCASKFGVQGLTQSLAKELGSRQIRVNAVCPVYVMTEGLKKALEGEASPVKGGSIESYLKTFAKEQSALGRLPTGEEVADTCLFLASEAASGITGQSIHVDCGIFPS